MVFDGFRLQNNVCEFLRVTLPGIKALKWMLLMYSVISKLHTKMGTPRWAPPPLSGTYRFWQQRSISSADTKRIDIVIWCDMITRYDIVDALCIHNYSVTYAAFIYDFIATCCTRSNSAPRSLLVKQLPPATKPAPGNAVLNVSSWSSVRIDSPSSLDLKFRTGHVTKSRSLRRGRFGVPLRDRMR